jgi:hypothetical protein
MAQEFSNYVVLQGTPAERLAAVLDMLQSPKIPQDWWHTITVNDHARHGDDSGNSIVHFYTRNTH